MSQFPYIDSSFGQVRPGLANAISRSAAIVQANISGDVVPSQPISNESRWYMQVTAIDTDTEFLTTVKYAGVEVSPTYDVAGFVDWLSVPNGRVAEIAGSDQTIFVTPRLNIGLVHHTVGDVIAVIERYDDNGNFFRWADTDQAADIRVGRIGARSGTVNASYVIEEVRHVGKIWPGVVPLNRITSDSDDIDWIAAEVGDYCLIVTRPNETGNYVLVGAIVWERVVVNDCPSTP